MKYHDVWLTLKLTKTFDYFLVLPSWNKIMLICSTNTTTALAIMCLSTLLLIWTHCSLGERERVREQVNAHSVYECSVLQLALMLSFVLLCCVIFAKNNVQCCFADVCTICCLAPVALLTTTNSLAVLCAVSFVIRWWWWQCMTSAKVQRKRVTCEFCVCSSEQVTNSLYILLICHPFVSEGICNGNL